MNWSEASRRDRESRHYQDYRHDLDKDRRIDRLEAGIASLNLAALPFAEMPGHKTHDLRLEIWKALQNGGGRWSIIWRIYTSDDGSFYQFTNDPHHHDTLEAALQHELSEIKERIEMNIFGTKLFPYLQGEMLKGKRVTMTIKDVRLKELSNSRTTDEKPIVYFRERDKGLVLNKTNARAIAELYGPETNDWMGQKLILFAEQGEWFGKHGWAIRVSDEYPENGKPAKPRPPEIVEELPFDYDGNDSDLDEEPVNDLAIALSAETLSTFIAHAYNVVPGYDNPKTMQDALVIGYPADNGLERFVFGKTKTGDYLNYLVGAVEQETENEQ